MLAAIAVLGMLSLAACSTSTDAPAGDTSAEAPRVEGDHVRVVGLWSGPEFDSFEHIMTDWETSTGGVVDWKGVRDIGSAIDQDLPDVAILPNPALLHQLAEDDRLVPLDSLMARADIADSYSAAWLDLGSHAGQWYGLAYKVTDKSTVWYNPRAFSAGGHEVPATWDEMRDLADQLVSNGEVPFSVVAPFSPGAGWALTDWVSNIVLKRCGPDVYDDWVTGAVPWTDDCITQSFELFDTIITTPGYVLDGSDGVLTTTDAKGASPLYADPPGAFMYPLASFAQAFIAKEYPNLEPGPDYNFFGFPHIDPEYAGAVTVGADLIVALNDTPASRSFISYLADSKAQETWIELGGFTSANLDVALDTYPDAVSRAIAEHLTDAAITRYSASDLMPPELQKAWWAAMVERVEQPGDLTMMLTELDRVAAQTR